MKLLVTGGAGFTPPQEVYSVYVLRRMADKRLYIGCTSNLHRRLEDHRGGRVRSTNGRGPWKLVYYETYRFREEAFSRERRLKQFGGTYRQLKRRLSHTGPM